MNAQTLNQRMTNIGLGSENEWRDELWGYGAALPEFPPLIARILAALNDPEASYALLVKHIEQHPVMASRVILLAKVLTTKTHGCRAVADVPFAATLIGLNRTREIVILSSIADFIADIAPAGIAANFWQHSVAVGVSSEQLAHLAGPPDLAPAALIAGLLHDVGQLWLYRFQEDAFIAAWRQDMNHSAGVEAAERERFGIDHATVGAWLAEHWSLPACIGLAIRHHHAPDNALSEPLVPLVHVAEVVSNALGLTNNVDNRVTSISSGACRMLGLRWGEPSHSLFVRIESRIRHAHTFLQQGANPQPYTDTVGPLPASRRPLL